MSNLAGLLESKGDYAAAEPLQRRALETRERTLGREHPSTLTSVNNLAELLESKGDYAGAEPLYRRALEARVRTLGKESSAACDTAHNLARLLKKTDRKDAATLLALQAYNGWSRSKGPAS